MERSTRQGLPAATVFAGMSRVTTLPAPMTQPFPMVTPGQTTTSAAAEPDIISDGDGTGKLDAFAALLRVDGMAGGVKAAVGTDHHMVAEGDLGAVEDDTVVVGIKVFAQVDVVAVIAPEARLNQKSSISAAQQLPQQVHPFLPLLVFGCVEGIAQLLAAGTQRAQFLIARKVGQTGIGSLFFGHRFHLAYSLGIPCALYHI